MVLRIQPVILRTYKSRKARGIQMNGQNRRQIKIGARVSIVLKCDQRTGKRTEGIVQKILTNAQHHPRGIKVMLENGLVGRVQNLL